jgi:DNA-directed RNA polymerase subunit M/transcription elongation factor TFIIS
MAENDDCPICHGKGKVPVLNQPEGRFAPIPETKFRKCEECGGIEKQKR